MDASGKQPSAKWQEVDAAVLRFGTDPESVSGAEFQAINRWLMGSLRKRFADTVEADLEDVSQDALVRFARSARDGKVDLSKSPSGYLLRTAMNAAVDKWRVTQRSRPVDLADFADLASEHSTDDEVAARLDTRANAKLVRHALATAHRNEDFTLIKVVSYFLEEAEEHGRLPSNRAAGDVLGLSHTGVANALRRFKELVGHTSNMPTSAPPSDDG